MTKSDLADEETRELTTLEIRELVAGSFLEGAPIVSVSARTGEGLDDLRRALKDAATRAGRRSDLGPVRLPIDRVFSVKGFGTVVTGTLVSGRVRPDERLGLEPSAAGAAPVTVRSVQVHGLRRDEAAAGQRTAINVAGLEVSDVERGQSLVTPGAFATTRIADATLELLPGARPLRHGARVRFHQGTAEIIGRVAVIGAAAGGGPPVVAPGSRGFVRLRLERPAVLTRHDRYILRAYSPPVTIAGGEILDPLPPRMAIRTAAAVARAESLAAKSEADGAALARLVEEAGGRAFPMGAMVSRGGVPPHLAEQHSARLTGGGRIERIGDLLVARTVTEKLETGMVSLLEQHHRSQPLSEGVPREEARERLFRYGHPSVFEHVVASLTASGTVATTGGRLALARHQTKLTPDEEQARQVVEEALRGAGLAPPDLASIVAQGRLSPAVADRVVHLLIKQKRVVKLDTLLFHEEALRGLKAGVAALKTAQNVRIDVATFKERFGVTRKFAIPLLEYLDRERVTRRVGDARVIL
jgi:selenocysteine-specific elongation factor